MRLPRIVALAAVAGLVASALPASAGTSRAKEQAADATVIAIIDSGFSPYHEDFLASKMPKAVRDLPLDRAPDTWLPGFPKRSSFASYSPMRLTLPTDSGDSQAALHTKDAKTWASVQESFPGRVHYRWMPGTKVIGAMAFGYDPATDTSPSATVYGGEGTIYGTGGDEHGMGTTSVAVGNTHGTCPECLLVFLQYTSPESAERALTWAMQQPWIDAISNSYGFSATVAGRDRLYTGTDTVTERKASTRGQTVFFSAGNGMENAFTVPNNTLLSSQEGPDWVVTVGATDPSDKDYSGTGKPADVAGIGTGYPSAYGSTRASGGDTFGGTSNATPQLAGTYAHVLWKARSLSAYRRAQHRGVVAEPTRKGVRALHAAELRQSLFWGATPTDGGYADGATGVVTTPGAPAGDARFASEGYGTFHGLLDGRPAYEASVTKRVLDPLLGRSKHPKRPAGEVEWFRVDSWCRQHIWGSWHDGAYVGPEPTPLPGPDPAWPTRTTLLEGCQGLQPLPDPVF